MDPAVKIQGLSVDISGHRILKDISANINEGEVLGLLGPSGAGKTTLIRSIVGRQKISKGEVEIFGYLAGVPELRSQIGYTPQTPAVYGDLTIKENISYFARINGYSKRTAVEAIREVDLSKHAGKLVSDLSGGQRSRVSLAIALLGRPRLLVLDEPTVGVDPLLRIRLWGLFRSFAEKGTTLIITSHVMEEADHCHNLMLIRNGRLLASGSPNELRAKTGRHSIEEAFLTLVETKK